MIHRTKRYLNKPSHACDGCYCDIIDSATLTVAEAMATLRRELSGTYFRIQFQSDTQYRSTWVHESELIVICVANPKSEHLAS